MFLSVLKYGLGTMFHCVVLLIENLNIYIPLSLFNILEHSFC
jgi:hypothetical protein